MMAYAFRLISHNETRFLDVETESFEHLEDLFAALINRSLEVILKQGVIRHYEQHEDQLSSPKGKINITNTIKKPFTINRKLHCEFDEYEINHPFNQIFKTTLINLIGASEKYRLLLTRKLRYFASVSTIDLKSVDWSTIKYHRNNRYYEFTLYLCQLLAKREIFSDQPNKSSLSSFFDQQESHQLFEKFVLEYYRVHYPQTRTNSRIIEWSTRHENALLPIMKTDVFMESEENVVILETKFYREVLMSSKRGYNDKIRSQHLYQIYAYVDNFSKKSIKNVSGVLLYAITSEDDYIQSPLMLVDHDIKVETIPLHKDFSIIRNQLDQIYDVLR
jgi:5-methylcytosine-specific restriction enzyme subunit McrC